jgi:hypothetical protein
VKDDTEDDFDSHEDEAAFLLVQTDTLISFLCILLMFVAVLMMAEHSKKSEASTNTIGRMCVQLSWPDRNIDLDLWGHSPGDPETVGYTNMHGKTLHLLWDVVGTIGNPSHTMVEMMCADSLTPGEWIFNVHYFANHEEQYDKTPPDLPAKAVEATVTARFKLPESRGSYDDFTSKFTFTREKQEKTMLRFVIDNNGRVVHSSINSNDVPLKRGWQGD